MMRLHSNYYSSHVQDAGSSNRITSLQNLASASIKVNEVIPAKRPIVRHAGCLHLQKTECMVQKDPFAGQAVIHLLEGQREVL
jgi:hypothetical protein